MSDPELVETLRRSKQLFGALYPVLVDPEGKVIDGRHRLEADPDWPKVTVDWLTNPIDALILRLISNTARRDVSAEEKSAALAEIAEKTGWKAREIAEALGMNYRWVVTYLPEKFKRAYERSASPAQLPEARAEEKPVAEEEEEETAKARPEIYTGYKSREEAEKARIEAEKPVEQRLDEAERKEAERVLGKPQEPPRVRTIQEAAKELGIHLPEPLKAKAPTGKCPFCGQSVNADHLNLMTESILLGEPELTVKELILRSRK